MTVPDVAAGQQQRLPREVREYLSAPSLRPLWTAVRDRLERNGMHAGGSPVRVALDDDGRDRLTGLLATRPAVTASGTCRVPLEQLDAALRTSAAARGLLPVVAEVTGSPLRDRRAERSARDSSAAAVWAELDAGLLRAGLGAAPWTAEWLAGVRRAGVLTRAGAQASAAAAHACATLGLLTAHLPLAGPAENLCEQLPAEPQFELAELASRATASAHGLDDGTVAAALVVRALATAFGLPVPAGAAARRELWATAGVTPDSVSGTVLVWALRPPGAGPWAASMRARADLGVVTHITLQEWAAAAHAEPWAAPEQRVHVCENPQVLQAAARAGVTAPLLCLSGNPATVGLRAVDALLRDGADVTYHGDFDIAGVAIAARLFARGVVSWRFDEQAYRDALAAVAHEARLSLSGRVAPTPWDPGLADLMNSAGVAMHEEALLAVLLEDLTVAD